MYTCTRTYTLRHPQPVFLAVVNLEKQTGCPELNLTFPCRKNKQTKNVSKTIAFICPWRKSYRFIPVSSLRGLKTRHLERSQRQVQFPLFFRYMFHQNKKYIQQSAQTLSEQLNELSQRAQACVASTHPDQETELDWPPHRALPRSGPVPCQGEQYPGHFHHGDVLDAFEFYVNRNFFFRPTPVTYGSSQARG